MEPFSLEANSVGSGRGAGAVPEPVELRPRKVGNGVTRNGKLTIANKYLVVTPLCETL